MYQVKYNIQSKEWHKQVKGVNVNHGSGMLEIPLSLQKVP